MPCIMSRAAAQMRFPLVIAAVLLPSCGSRSTLQLPSRALHAAALDDHAGEAALLIAQGADVDERADADLTPLHVAVTADAAETATVLLCGGASQLRDSSGQLPLHAAAAAGADDCCAVLLQAGAAVDVVDGFGWTPLRWAVLNGHASTTAGLISAGADADIALEGLSPLALAAAAGHSEVVAVLLAAGMTSNMGVDAYEVAVALGRDEIAILLSEHGMPFAPRPSLAELHEVTELKLERVCSAVLTDDRSHWDRAFVTSTPLLVAGLASPWCDDIACRTPSELAARWGDKEVTVAYSPDEWYQRPVPVPVPIGTESLARRDAGGAKYCLREVPTRQMKFHAFIEQLAQHGLHEHCAVSQSPSEHLDEFIGLPAMPPLLERLIGNECNRKNLWVCLPPKVSALHYDTDDSVLLQLSGTKRFTLFAPQPLHGLTVHPTVLDVLELEREAPGIYRHTSAGRPQRSVRHFPAVNVTQPDLQAHPLFRHAAKMVVDVPAGNALLLPAYWYHEVESFAPPGRLNVAVNYWFDANVDGAVPAYLHRVLRSKLMDVGS